MKAHVFTLGGSSFEVENNYASLNGYIRDVKRSGGIWFNNGVREQFYPYHAIHYFIDLSKPAEQGGER